MNFRKEFFSTGKRRNFQEKIRTLLLFLEKKRKVFHVRRSRVNIPNHFSILPREEKITQTGILLL